MPDSRIDPRVAFAAVLLVGVSIHLPILDDGLNPDATRYMETAHLLMASGTLERDSLDYPRHPPLMALIFVPFGTQFGFNEFAVHALEVSFLFVDLVVLYFVSLRRLGPWPALVPPVLLSVDPVVYINMSEGRSLTVLILFALLTLWAIWKAIENSRWLPLAAVTASLAYLTADAVGYLFVVAGFVGLLWRISYKGWRVVTDPWYLVAASIFFGVVGAWMAYNLSAIGSPYTDPRAVGYLDRLLTGTPFHVTVVATAGLAVYFLFYLSQTGWPFLLFSEGRKSTAGLLRRAIQDQHVGALILFIAVAVLISAVMAASFLLYEPLRSLSTVDTYLRYPAVVAPFAYLAVGMHVRSIDRSSAPHARWAIPVVLAVLLLAFPLPGKAVQGQQNSVVFDELARAFESGGVNLIYADVRAFLQYNLPQLTVVEVSFDVRELFLNLTSDDVPVGATLVTLLLVPASFDRQIGGFYVIERFEPTINSPFRNLVYGA